MNLNELVVTLAIAGGVITVAVPQFEVYHQKAKQVEAKIGLGALYKAQQGFIAEHNAYGSNIKKLGFVMEGVAADRVYTIGFPSSSCSETAVKPSSNSSVGNIIQTVHPSYYSDVQTLSPRVGQTSCAPGSVDDNGTQFLATASGAIAPELEANAPLSQQDIWTIDENRQLINTQDGVVVPEEAN